MGSVRQPAVHVARRARLAKTSKAASAGRPARSENPIIELQRRVGNAAVTAWLAPVQRQADPSRRSPGVDLVEPAAQVLPPATARSAGAGPALLAVIQSTGLTDAAVQLLASRGYRDVNALTNFAFWAAHPDLFGTKLLSSQPDFATLAAEWVRLRDTVVAQALASARRPTTPPGPGATPGGATAPHNPSPGNTAPGNPAPGNTAPGNPAPGNPAPGNAAVVADRLRSTIDLLPEAQAQRFRGIPWGWADYPGTQFPTASMTPQDLARFRSDQSLVYSDAEKAFVGKHQSDALALFSALARNRPGGGERRVNTGDTAMITKEEFAARSDKAAVDRYIEGQVDSAPLPGGGRLNTHAAEAFRTMRADALRDGVELRVISGFRSRASEEAGARQNTNRWAFGGFSPHSLGLAADIALRVGTSAHADFTETSTRMDKLVGILSSPAYKWVYLNGAAYGFFQYRAEPWHWEYNPPGFKQTFWADM